MIIESHKGRYEARFEEDFRTALSRELRPTDVLIVDDNVRQIHSRRIDPLLKEYAHFLISPSEKCKSYRGIEEVIENLINAGFRKHHRLVAIGGGITQDITAFTASVLYRGVQWLFVPTTLLAQCDSCIGSKTSINFDRFKNQLGSFHPPSLVLIDLNWLSTLHRRDIRSGMGEMLHYFLLSGRADFDLIRQSFDQAFVDPVVMKTLVMRSLSIKRAVIEIDEFDTGPRNVFNYGHSFGHAIESYTQYSVPHGIAVTFGMDMANQVSVQLGHLSACEAAEMRQILEKNWSPDSFCATDIDIFLSLLAKDKKNVEKEIRLILSRGVGNMFIARIKQDHSFREVLRGCFDYYLHYASAA